MTTTLPEITDLFSRLASYLQTLNQTSPIHNEEEESINLSISKFNQSLNLSDDSRVRVLDTALSLMCFGAPKVFDSIIDYLVNTIVSVLSASITCKALRFRNEELLLIGSSISRHDCVELIKACDDVLEKLDGRGMLTESLSGAVVRVAVSASSYQFSFPFTHLLNVKSIDGRHTPVPKLLCYLRREFSLDKHEIPLRLLIWYLDPLTLKHDVSEILQDTMKRPFLYLSKELHERMDWRAVIICLIVSPTMFIETRALLHDWFLLTGLASILEFLIGLVSVILDIISSPTWWGISMEVGSKLPFSSAYFPYQNHLFRTLSGPLSSEGFLSLVQATDTPVFHARKQFHPTINPTLTKVVNTDHKSIWALAISFPAWFSFASVLLFSEKSDQEIFHSKCTLASPKFGQIQDVELVSAAVKYIAWILSPIKKSQQELLVDYLTKISEAWTQKQFGSDGNHKEAEYRKKAKKPKFHDNTEDYTLRKEYDCRMIGLWLKEFQSLYMKYGIETVNNPAPYGVKGSQGLSLQKNLLLRRIPLGILVGFPNRIKEEGCELLLHYAATGRIIQLRETNRAGLKHRKGKSQGQEDSPMWPVEFSKREAVAGACLVFNLTDIVESMSGSLSETEEIGVEFIYQVKVKTGKYLIRCINRLIQLNIEEDGIQMLLDLSSRLMRWRHQGKEIVHFDKHLDDVISVLSTKLSSI